MKNRTSAGQPAPLRTRLHTRPLTHLKPHLPARLWLLAAAAALSACGGGGGGTTTTDTTPVTPAALSLRGTAATGKALAGASVAAKCAGGTGTATTGTDGSFSVSITGGSLPCAVKVTGSDGSVLHSVAAGSGSSATVNISPLTELIVAQAAGGTAADLFANFDAAAQARLTPAALTSATASVASALRSVVDIGTADPIRDPLVAANGSTAGNALDQKLDTLTAALAAARVSVAELGSAIVTNGGAAATVVASQVRPAAATCASLRSGEYRVINPNESDPAYRWRKVSIDAVALTMTVGGQTSSAAVPVAGRACEFTADGGRSRMVVSPAGVVVNRYLDGSGGQPRLEVAFPEQTIDPSELAGTWNTVEFDQGSGSTLVNSYAVATVDTAGRISAGQDCQYLQPCTAWTGTLPAGFTANAAGGFTVTDSDGSTGRFFAYRAPSGDLMLVGGDSTGLIVGTKQRSQSVPALGEVTPYWNVSVNGSGVAGNLIYEVGTVSSVDPASGTYTRTTTSDGRVDTFAVNAPRTGLRYRAVNACRTSSGAAGTCSGVISMPLAGMGVSVFGSAVSTNAFFGVNVNRPAGSSGTGTADSSTGSPSGTGGTAAIGTLATSTGQTYALRVSLTVNAAGQVTGGQYDWHTLAGTLTPCTYSPELQNTCFGTNGGVSRSSQSGAIGTAGANGVTLSVGPDGFGYTLTGTLNGTTWSGTWTKAATATVPGTQSGTFAVVLSITQVN